MRATNLIALLLGIGGTALAGPIDATGLPQCTAGTASQWIAYGTSGCRIGDGPFSISSFSFQQIGFPVSTSGATPIAGPGDIQVTPGNDVTETLKFSSALFDVSFPHRVVYEFRYLIDPPPEIIPGFEGEIFANTPSGGGFAQLQTRLCAGSRFVGGNCLPQFGGTLYEFVLINDGAPVCTNCAGGVFFAQPTNIVDVIQILTLDATANPQAKSEITAIGGSVPFLVPEPSTYALFGSGLGALLLLRRRRRS